MINIADCLVQTHELRLVALACLVCLFASGTAFNLFPRSVSERNRPTGIIWLLLTATVAGSGIWATHFIAMLAFQPLVPVAFELWTTVLSILIAVAVTSAAFAVVVLSPFRAGRAAGGVLLGLATVAMHYTGIAGMRLPGVVVWDYELVALSGLLSVAFAAPALLIGLNGTRRVHRVSAAVLFALSIGSLHFTGMSAITIVFDPAHELSGKLLSGDSLGYGVAAITLLIIACALASWSIDRRSRRESEQRVRFLARHDLLTSLPNRLLFEEIVRRELSTDETFERRAAVFCIDLDGFKEINDIFGHPVGDRLLVQVSLRLQKLLGERCVAARLGGDEFAMLVTGLGATKTPASAAQQVVDGLGAPFEIDGNRMDIGCSIGISLFPADGRTYQALLSNADVALARAKSDGKGMFRFFEPAMDAAIRERRKLARDLRDAIGTAQLRLEYQPQTDLASDRVTGFEALLRWTHPENGPIAPSTFVPVAEETGLILPIGEWVLREACREAASWTAPLGIAVNLSVAQFRQSGLPETVQAILDETGLAPARLELEVTESLFIESGSRALHTLARIKESGVRIAMDDFGTGYSSLSTLQSFPFDRIKIDRSFTHQLGCAKSATAIVKAILGLGESLGIEVVAEGVETAEQLAYLREHRCGEVQGFLLGRPRDISAYSGLVDARPERATVVQLRRA